MRPALPGIRSPGATARPSLVVRAGADDELGLSVADQDDEQVADHGGPASCALGISTVMISSPACAHRYSK
jgi:hypothetical protein